MILQVLYEYVQFMLRLKPFASLALFLHVSRSEIPFHLWPNFAKKTAVARQSEVHCFARVPLGAINGRGVALWPHKEARSSNGNPLVGHGHYLPMID